MCSLHYRLKKRMELTCSLNLYNPFILNIKIKMDKFSFYLKHLYDLNSKTLHFLYSPRFIWTKLSPPHTHSQTGNCKKKEYRYVSYIPRKLRANHCSIKGQTLKDWDTRALSVSHQKPAGQGMCAILQSIYFDKILLQVKKINLWLGVSYLLSELLGGLRKIGKMWVRKRWFSI